MHITLKAVHITMNTMLKTIDTVHKTMPYVHKSVKIPISQACSASSKDSLVGFKSTKQ